MTDGAGRNRLRRKAGDMLDAAEALFLESRDQHAVAQHGGRNVSVVAVETDDQHRD